MNQEQTPPKPATVSVVNYSDEVTNLVLSDGDTQLNIHLSDEQASKVCRFFGVDVPVPEPEPTEQWG